MPTIMEDMDSSENQEDTEDTEWEDYVLICTWTFILVDLMDMDIIMDWGDLWAPCFAQTLEELELELELDHPIITAVPAWFPFLVIVTFIACIDDQLQLISVGPGLEEEALVFSKFRWAMGAWLSSYRLRTHMDNFRFGYFVNTYGSHYYDIKLIIIIYIKLFSIIYIFLTFLRNILKYILQDYKKMMS